MVSLYFTGGTLNVISMAGITLAIGSLVDNAVVVVENVHRKKELGLPIKDAVTQGAGEVAVAITLATLTSIVVFVPLIFLSAQRSLRIAMAALGYTFSVSLLASLLAALVFIPVALYRLERDPNSRLERGLARVRGVLFWPFALPGKLVSRLRAKPAQPQAFAGEIESVTERSISAARPESWERGAAPLEPPPPIVGNGRGGSCSWPPPSTRSRSRRSRRAGGDDGSSVRIRIELPQNTTLAQASDELAFYENLCLGMYDDLKFFDMSSDFSRLGGSISIWFDRGFTRSEREEMRKKIRAAIPDRATSRALLDDMGMGGDAATGVRFVLLGRDSDQLAEFGERVKDQLLKVPQLTNVRSELERGRQEVRVRVDRAQAQKMSLNPTMISGAVEWGLRGYLLSRIQEKDIDRQLIIQYEGAENSTLQDLADTKLFTANGSDIPLSAVAHFEVGKSYGQIFRRDGKTSLAISADVLEGDAKSATALARKALAPLLVELPRDVQLDEEGRSRISSAMPTKSSAPCGFRSCSYSW